jgi:hypothetical protein
MRNRMKHSLTARSLSGFKKHWDFCSLGKGLHTVAGVRCCVKTGSQAHRTVSCGVFIAIGR